MVEIVEGIGTGSLVFDAAPFALNEPDLVLEVLGECGRVGVSYGRLPG